MRIRCFCVAMVFCLLFCMGGTANGAGWAKTYGGLADDVARSVEVTEDDKYIVGGFTNSFGAPLDNVWVLVLDANGNEQLQKAYGGNSYDYAVSVKRISDGYVAVGYTNSPSAGWKYDAWVAKFDGQFSPLWQKTYGGYGNEYAFSFQEITGGGYVIVGSTDSFGAGAEDLWVIRLDSSGSIVLHKAYGGPGVDRGSSIQQTSDGGFIVAGYSDSFGTNSLDVWVLKLDSAGNIMWQKVYGGKSTEYASQVVQASEGGYIVAAHTYSFGSGNKDVWLLKLDAYGNIEWQKTYGGAKDDEPRSIVQTSDGGYIMAGGTVSFGAGSRDMWLLKLDNIGNIVWEKTYGGTGLDGANFVKNTQDGGYIVVGYTTSYGVGKHDVLVLKVDENGNIDGCNCINSSQSVVQSTNVTGVNTSAAVTTLNISPTYFSLNITDTKAQATQLLGGVSNFQLNVTKSGMGNALVSSNPSGINCGNDCIETYAPKTQVTLTAQSDENSVLGGWSGDCAGCGKQSTCTITVDSDKKCGIKMISALKDGWNLLSIVGDNDKNINDIISGKTEKIASVWKWVRDENTAGKWAVYLPNQANGGSSYASSKGFDIISTIKVGEGFWVNVKNLEQGEKLAIE